MGYLAHETAQDLAPLQRVGHLGVELKRVQSPRLVGHRGKRRIVALRDRAEPGRQGRHPVAVARPDIQNSPVRRVAIVRQTVEQTRAAQGAHLRRPELAVGGGFDFPAELGGHGLHAIANSEHRNAHRKCAARRLGPLRFVNGLGAAGQDDGARLESLDLRRIRIPGVDLRIHAQFTHAAGDQLGVLRAEIENQNPVGMNVGHQPIR